jgi:predicted esterase
LPGHDIGAVFYPDLSKDEQQKWLEHLVKAPKSTSFYSPKKLSYTEIDTVFVYCEKDMAFPYPAQKAVIQALKSQGLQFQEESLPSGHFPSLSMPDRLADIIVKYILVR